MIVIGERINATRKKIKEAIEKKDRNFIKKEIRKQIENGQKKKALQKSV